MVVRTRQDARSSENGRGFAHSRESRGDTLIDGSRLGTAIRLVIRRLDGLEGEGVVALGQFQSDTGHRGGGAVFDGQDDAILTVAAEIEVGIAPGVEFG